MVYLYSDPACPFSHIARIIIALKAMECKLINITSDSIDDILAINPYGELPILIDDVDKNNKKKDLTLIDIRIIAEYLDRRFPHPQLLPVEPSELARMNSMLYFIDREILSAIRVLEKKYNPSVKSQNSSPISMKKIEEYKNKVTVYLTQIAAIFTDNKKRLYVFNDSLSLVDMFLIPILWRINYYDIETKKSWANMIKYADYHFEQDYFIDSLTSIEKNIHKDKFQHAINKKNKKKIISSIINEFE